MPMIDTHQSPRIPAWPPAWADRFGEDHSGVFAEFEVEGVNFVLRWIPPGRFMMGSPDDEAGRTDREGPRHEVTISRGFWLGETPVTQEQWAALGGKKESRFDGLNLPVERVNHEDCMTWCAALNAFLPGLGARLPTEAEWEYACRAGTESAFNDGSACTKPEGKDPALEKLGWYEGNSGSRSHAVKGKVPNSWGLHDMHGNVWEWCLDGLRSYSEAAVTDPVGPLDEGSGRVVRGGSWVGRAGNCRAACRSWFEPDLRGGGLGFRLAAGQEPGGAERPEPERRSRG